MTDAELDPGTPWRRDLGAIGPALEQWARHTVGDGATVSNVASPANGMSSETVLFDLAHDGTTESFAARLAPMAEVYPVRSEERRVGEEGRGRWGAGH